MNKGLVMLVLITLFGSSFMSVLNVASGDINDDQVISITEMDSAGSSNPVSDPVRNEDIIEERGDILTPVGEKDFIGPRQNADSDGVEYFSGLGEAVEHDYPNRGATNTSTLLYLREAPKKVYYGESFNIKGTLLEDNNSDGQRNGGDLPIKAEWVHILWNDGSQFKYEDSNMTHPHPDSDKRSTDLQDGEFNFTLTANETNIAANGDPDSDISGIELVIYYEGVWTDNGMEFYNISDNEDLQPSKLFTQVKGKDDDGDAQIKQLNNVDDDGDGELNSPDSFKDLNGDGKYQLGEPVANDRSTGDWIDLDKGLKDFLDNDGMGEYNSPDSYLDGSNGFPEDGILERESYQDGEEIGRSRYESHFTSTIYNMPAGGASPINIGGRGKGTEITYDWSANETSATVDLQITDGTYSYDISTDSSGSSGTFMLPRYGDSWNLVFSNDGSSDINVTYDIDIDEGWVFLGQAIADGKDNDLDGIVDEGIDERIDDGRPEIPAKGAPEPIDLRRNNIDDDGDGIIDDGYPGIKPYISGEGIDEEIFDGIDNDGDGLTDEDTSAFIAREPAEIRIYIEIWHKTELTININKNLANVGDEFIVSGKITDKSYEDTTMGTKTLWLYWDGTQYAKTETIPSGSTSAQYEFVVNVPVTSAGPHKISVEFSPGFNKTNNYYFDPSNATEEMDVRRPTKIIFTDVQRVPGQEKWDKNVYRGDTIYLNGSIVDKILWDEERIMQGPKLLIDGREYGNNYRFHVQWGESYQKFQKEWPGKFLMNQNGSFSIEYDLKPEIQPLGPVKVSVRTTWDMSPGRDPLMYYTWADENSTEFIVRAESEIELWIDQNQENGDDKNEGLNSFITRKPFKGPDGEIRDWNVARVRGILKDSTLSYGGVDVGIPQQRITFYWNYGLGDPFEVKFEDVQLDQEGYIEINVPIPANHKLGPVNIFCAFTPEAGTSYYDSSVYSDFDGDPFSVVSFTNLEVNASTAIKGKNINVRGRLTDDRGVGVGNRTVSIFRLERWSGNYDDLTETGGLGSFLGSVKTSPVGKFTFTDSVVEKVVSVGTMWVVARYTGSEEFPYGPGGKRFAPGDAYMGKISEPREYLVTSETAVVLQKYPTTLTRGEETRITGYLYESYQGRTLERGVPGRTVSAYVRQNDRLISLGVGRTSKEQEFAGYFEIKVTNVPSDLDVGEVDIIVEYEPEPVGDILYLSSRNITIAEIFSSTRIKEVYFGPIDVDDPQDGKRDFFEDEIEDWIFTFQVLEGTSADTSGEEVQFGVVWLNITMGAYKNTTRQLTDVRGRVNFNFTSIFTDSSTGEEFKIPSLEDQHNMTVSVEFGGRNLQAGGGYKFSQREYDCMYHLAEPPEPTQTPWLVIFLAIGLVLGLVLIGVFFFYKWIEKKRRLRSLKKIIKKAADQLETGNPYSAVIFKSYQKLGAHLRRYGFMRRDADTFREFEDAVRAALPVDENSLDNFLDILEEARYSKHVIGETHRDRAISCLRGVEGSLDNIIFDEEAALRQMELADEDYVETEIVVKDKGGKGA